MANWSNREKNITTENAADLMGVIQAIHTHQIHAQVKWLDKIRRLRNANQWRDHITIRHVYGRMDEIEVG